VSFSGKMLIPNYAKKGSLFKKQGKGDTLQRQCSDLKPALFLENKTQFKKCVHDRLYMTLRYKIN
jgi:hypothetical protein